MNKKTYRERRTYLKYDDTHIIGYLNEVEVKDYQPERLIHEEDASDVETWPTAYAYTGEETDGGTIMRCETPEDYGELANAIIRTRYSESKEAAIHRHAINGDYADAPAEYDEYNAWCLYAIKTAKSWLGIA